MLSIDEKKAIINYLSQSSKFSRDYAICLLEALTMDRTLQFIQDMEKLIVFKGK